MLSRIPYLKEGVKTIANKGDEKTKNTKPYQMGQLL